MEPARAYTRTQMLAGGDSSVCLAAGTLAPRVVTGTRGPGANAGVKNPGTDVCVPSWKAWLHMPVSQEAFNDWPVSLFRRGED